MGWIREKLSKIKNKIKDWQGRETKHYRTPETFMPKAFEVETLPEPEPRKEERFYYRNAGFNRAEKNNLAGQIRKLKKKRSPNNIFHAALLRKLLEASPANIPYVRYRIPKRHAGIASPEEYVR